MNKFVLSNTNRGLRSARSLSAMVNFKAHLAEQLDGINNAGTYKKERIITSKQASFITVKNSDKKILNFCANNYLGLSVRTFIVTLY